MRTINELEVAALTLRAQLIAEGKDPLDGTFSVTQEERYLIRMEPIASFTVDHQQDRFCGLKLHVI